MTVFLDKWKHFQFEQAKGTRHLLSEQACILCAVVERHVHWLIWKF